MSLPHALNPCATPLYISGGESTVKTPTHSTTIGQHFSIYLDAVRFLAALCVFIEHSTQFHLYNGWVPLSSFSHTAVIAFFVLSGLVIASAASRNGETGRKFTVDRAARIYSVAIPAIALSYFLGLMYAALHGGTFDQDWSKQAVNPSLPFSAAIFLTQSWHSAELPWNGPYWSLCYEVWYYVIFGTLFFVKGPLGKILAVGAGLVAGPAIVALLPVWWCGVWISRHPEFSFGHKKTSWIVFFASAMAIVWLSHSTLQVVIRVFMHEHVPSYWRLYASQRLITDYLLGLLVTANFLAFRDVQTDVGGTILSLRKPVKFLAGFTFSIYLFHYPVIRFCEVTFPNRENSVLHYVAFMAAILTATMILGAVTEHKKHVLRRLLQKWI